MQLTIMKSQEDGICSCFCSGGEGQKYLAPVNKFERKPILGVCLFVFTEVGDFPH